METNFKKILIIDKKPKNLELITQILEKDNFECFGAETYEQIDFVLDNQLELKVAIIDVVGFNEQIWKRCKRIHQRKIPFLVLSSHPNLLLQKESINHGASSLVTKPVLIKEFLKLLNSIINE